MAYRRSTRYQERIRRRVKAMQAGRERARMERPAVARWSPPDLRRRLIIEDYDTGTVQRVVIDMHATPRIDSYRVTIDGKPQPGRLGWSRILDRVRLAMPRKCSPRWLED